MKSNRSWFKRLPARNPHFYHRDVEKHRQSVLDEITERVCSEGHRVELRGFGAFSVKNLRPRSACNPRTGEPGASVEEKLGAVLQEPA